MMADLHSLAALRQAADHLRAEERHWWADTIMAAIETLASEGSAVDAIERVREMHAPISKTVFDGISFVPHDTLTDCGWCDTTYPCLTIQALDGMGTDDD